MPSADLGYLGDDVGSIQQGLCLRPLNTPRRFANVDCLAGKYPDASSDIDPLRILLLGGTENVIHDFMLVLLSDSDTLLGGFHSAYKFNRRDHTRWRTQNGYLVVATFTLQECIQFGVQTSRVAF